ncbi:tetratricopeptide repeat protein [uncultured Bacteroides sp.]|uniref:tetratricopeptide repeat protein n=1 Tax=uncultured Bacteroides sp. TaxID=162156 RepID=UPI002AAB6924|nr:tetratricopeptide repeat protein [uncultured Bacteroides sp.]
MKRNVLLLLMCLLFSGIHAQNYKELFDKATHCEETDSLVQAEKYYREALKVDPTNAHNCMIFADLGRLQYRMQRYQEALQSYDYAVNLAPLTVSILMDRASLNFEMGNTDKAYVDCCTVLDVNKNNAKALFLRAYLQSSRRQYKEAEVDYKRLLELEPQSISGRLGLAILYQQEQKYKESLELLNKLIIEAPDDAELYVIRAGVEKEIIQLDFSLIDLDKAISLSPKSANAYMLRGEILLSQKKKEMAKQDFEKAIELGVSRSDLIQQLKECK